MKEDKEVNGKHVRNRLMEERERVKERKRREKGGRRGEKEENGWEVDADDAKKK